MSSREVLLDHTCHPTPWSWKRYGKNTVNTYSKHIDLEGVTVSYAATEFAQFGTDDRDISRIYLEALLEPEEGSGSPGVAEEDVGVSSGSRF
jgi:hypothetical protein